METLEEDPSVKIYSQFKSYYVVWKLTSAVPSCDAFVRFKSYYVVWKLGDLSLYKGLYYGLNRTM